MALLLHRVRQGDFPRPREVNRTVPPALEAICLKAMARQPEDRYPSAGSFAGALSGAFAGSMSNVVPGTRCGSGVTFTAGRIVTPIGDDNTPDGKPSVTVPVGSATVPPLGPMP